MTKQFRSRYPRYPDDSDYKTNAPSYYDDLARKNKLIEILAEKIYGYEKVLAENLAEIERVLNAVIDKIGEGFNQEIVTLLKIWVQDGTLDHIINETLMNKKADKSELIVLDQRLTKEINDYIEENDLRLDEFERVTDEKITDLEKKVGTELDEKLIQAKEEQEEFTKEKMAYLVKNLDLQMFNMQMRNQASDKSFVSVQGACYISGSGDNINYALAFLPTDENFDNQGMIINANSQGLISESGGTALELHHANGMDYNPKTDSIFVAHANRQSRTAGASSDNRISEVDKSGNRIKRVISPSNIPEGRRIKYYSYDKVTEKQYAGDDYGIYELDDSFKVIKQIDFDPHFTNQSWGLAQSTAIHNDYIFLVTGGPFGIAVFDMEGDFLNFYQIPKVTKDGFYTGSHPQSIFFDNENNFYMVGIGGAISLDLNKFYTKIFKGNLFVGNTTGAFLGSHNTNTANTLYVTANPKSPKSDGTKSYPFHSINEAINYMQSNQDNFIFQKQIHCLAGSHAGANILTNGLVFELSGDEGAIIRGLRMINTTIRFSGLTIVPERYDYAIDLQNAKANLEGVLIDAKQKGYGIRMNAGSELVAPNNRGNVIKNYTTFGISVVASTVIGTLNSLGLVDDEKAIGTSSTSNIPLITIGQDEEGGE